MLLESLSNVWIGLESSKGKRAKFESVTTGLPRDDVDHIDFNCQKDRAVCFRLCWKTAVVSKKLSRTRIFLIKSSVCPRKLKPERDRAQGYDTDSIFTDISMAKANFFKHNTTSQNRRRRSA